MTSREAGDGLVGDAGFVAMLEDAGHFRAGGGRHGDEDGFDGLGRDDGGQSRAVAEDLHPVNEVPAFAGSSSMKPTIS